MNTSDSRAHADNDFIAAQIRGARLFIRSFSYREFMTSISLALLLVALFRLFAYYSNEHWIRDNTIPLGVMLLVVVTAGNHVLYKIEHGRSNNFIGRNIHDYIFIVTFCVLQWAFDYIIGADRHFDFDDPGATMVGVVLVTMAFEACLSLLKQLLKKNPVEPVLRTKLLIAGFSILLLTTITLLDTNFFSPVTITRWGKLSWDNFKGITPPFTSFGAAISSKVYMEYDSGNQQYVAFAGQNDIHSWVKSNETDSEYGLNHEQYHFNITELHARKMNTFIAEHPGESRDYYEFMLAIYNHDLGEMQSRYDRETNHSLIYDKQRRWEFTIDSLLTLERGWVIDKFSGAKVYFPSEPDSATGLANEYLPYRQFMLNKYGMNFSVISYLPSSAEYKDLVVRLRQEADSLSSRYTAFFDDSARSFRAFMIMHDTSGFSRHTLWIGNRDYLYRIRSDFPTDTADSTGYAQNAASFINSFSIANTNAYWITKFEAESTAMTELASNLFFSIAASGAAIGAFYRRPFHTEDGTVLLPCDFVIHTDSLRHVDVLQFHHYIIQRTPKPGGQIFAFPPGDDR